MIRFLSFTAENARSLAYAAFAEVSVGSFNAKIVSKEVILSVEATTYSRFSMAPSAIWRFIKCRVLT